VQSLEAELRNGILALLIHDHSDALESLRLSLRNLPLETYSVRTLAEAERIFRQRHPELLFTDTSFADGSWTDVIRLAERGETPADVIVVGHYVDINLYVSALESGAFDFIVPPFERDSLDYIIHSATEDVNRRRRIIYSVAA
jgi:DNA-binding NtrC family response regulator